MHMDPVMPQAVGAALLILLTGFVLKLLRQPHVVAYLLAGILIGPFGLALVSDANLISRLGAIGVVLLLFFVGMEVDPSKLIAHWKLAVFGTLLQILLSIACVWVIAQWFDWPWARVLLIGFVISLSSTAVVIKLLQDSQLLDTRMGQGVLGVLLAQDLAIIPMLIVLGLMGAGEVDTHHLALQGVGTVLAGVLFAYIVVKREVHLPLSQWLDQDHELQLFAALSVCFGLALITAWFDLSTALGAFLAGMLIGAAKETQWVHHALEPLKVLFVALFFVSIGMLLDINYLIVHWPQTVLLVLVTFFSNTFINALILKGAEYTWRDSLFAGVLLSQIGEFSFVLAALGFQTGMIHESGYQLALCVISLSLILSPAWISGGKLLLKWQSKESPV